MLSLIQAFGRDERGAVATEYAFLIIFVALAIVTGVSLLGNGINRIFSVIGNYVANLTIPAPI